jgi:hypothetical protein
LILYAVIRLREAFSVRHLVYALIGVLFVSTMRFYVAYLALAVMAGALLIPRARMSHRAFLGGLVLIAVAIPLLATLGFLDGTRERVQTFDLKFVEHYRNVTSLGPGAGSGVRTNFDVKTPTGAVLATLFGLVHLLMAPFPWQLGRASLKMLLTIPELLIWWWLFARGVVPGLMHAVRHRFSAIQPLLLFLVPLSLLYGIMFANLGLVFRQRAQLLPFYLIFAALGLVLRRRHRVAAWMERLRLEAEGANRWRLRARRPALRETAVEEGARATA